MASFVHRAWDTVNSQYLYWKATKYDPNGDQYNGGTSFSNLEDITLVGSPTMAIITSPETNPHKILDAQGTDNSAPSAAGDGADIEGWPTLNLYYEHATSGNTSVVDIYLYDTESWFLWGEQSLSEDEGILDPFDAEGWDRIYTHLKTPPSDTVTFKVFPHNE